MRALTVASIAIGMAALGRGETRSGFSTYLGGFHDDAVTRVAIDNIGTVHVAGVTKSRPFPQANPFSSAGPEQRICSVGPALFPFTYLCPVPSGYYSSIRPDGTTLIRSTYLDDIKDVALDHKGDVYLSGSLDPRVLAATRGAWRTEPLSPARTGFIARMEVSTG